MIVKDIRQLTEITSDVLLTIGTFDGYHLGHQKVISTLLDEAKKQNCPSVVVTFLNHPREVILKKPVPYVMDAEAKLELLDASGVDYVVALPFTEELRHMSAPAFLEYLGLRVRTLIIGYDFRFGYRGNDPASTLDIPVIQVEADLLDGHIISSTLLRDLMAMGDIKKLNRCLGRPYAYKARVIHGYGLGATMGFPTLNLNVRPNLYTLRKGVYITKAHIRGETYESVTSVGDRPTFPGRPFSIETFLLDVEGNFYDEEVTLEFLGFIRDEMTFDSKQALMDQIARDVVTTKQYFSTQTESLQGESNG